jgi:DNA-directed RNA polymerase subunit K/omega
MKAKQTPSSDQLAAGELAALRRAAKRALELGIATDTPVWVMENGKIVDIAKRERRKRRAAAKR